jgi:hypothetical protein
MIDSLTCRHTKIRIEQRKIGWSRSEKWKPRVDRNETRYPALGKLDAPRRAGFTVLLPLTAEAAESIWNTFLRALEGGSRLGLTHITQSASLTMAQLLRRWSTARIGLPGHVASNPPPHSYCAGRSAPRRELLGAQSPQLRPPKRFEPKRLVLTS